MPEKIPLHNLDSKMPYRVILFPSFHSLQADLPSYAVTKLCKRRNKGTSIASHRTFYKGLVNFYQLKGIFLQG